MAGGITALLQLLAKVNASNALVVSGDSGASTGTKGTLGNLQGKVDSSNRLVVKFE